MSHLTEEQLVDHTFGGDDASEHLRDCTACADRARDFDESRAALRDAIELSSTRRRPVCLNVLPLAAAAAVLVTIVVIVSRPPKRTTVAPAVQPKKQDVAAVRHAPDQDEPTDAVGAAIVCPATSAPTARGAPSPAPATASAPLPRRRPSRATPTSGRRRSS